MAAKQNDNPGEGFYQLPPLGYAYDVLEPHFDEETMRIHYTKHHQSYVDQANELLKKVPAKYQRVPVEDLITRLRDLPESVQTGLRNHGGGHANHSMFWRGLKKGTKLTGSLKQAIDKEFGSFDKFRDEFETAAKKRFGSGWAWLVLTPKDKKLKVVSTANQDSPLMGKEVAGCEGFPVLGLDVWEHAYYLKWQNRRPDYIKEFWSVVNWDYAQERFELGLRQED